MYKNRSNNIILLLLVVVLRRRVLLLPSFIIMLRLLPSSFVAGKLGTNQRLLACQSE